MPQTFFKRWMFRNNISTVDLLPHAIDLVGVKTMYDITNRANPMLKDVLVFQVIASRKKRRYVSVSELYLGQKSSLRINNFGTWNLSPLMKLQKIRHQTIADRIGVKKHNIWQWLDRPLVVRMDKIYQIAQFFGVTIEDLFNPDLPEIAAYRQQTKVVAMATAVTNHPSEAPQKHRITFKPLPETSQLTRESQSQIVGIPEKINRNLDKFIAEKYDISKKVAGAK